jgi:hypothetical protein
VVISHTDPEKEIALAFKELFENSFVSMLDEPQAVVGKVDIHTQFRSVRAKPNHHDLYRRVQPGAAGTRSENDIRSSARRGRTS